MIGFIKIHRKILNWEWYSDINTTRIFFHLLLTANFKPNKWHGHDIARGQLITSLANLAKSTSLSVRSVRTSLTKLKTTQELTIKTTKTFSLITLTNYDLYQEINLKNDTDNDTRVDTLPTHDRQSSDTRPTTTKEGKEVKKVKEDKNLKYYPLVEGLIFVLEATLKKSLSNSKKSWSEEIRKLIEIDLEPRTNAIEDVKRAIQAISDNFGKEYFPIIQSAASFREKFIKIENYLTRSQGNKLQSNQEIYNNLTRRFENE